MDGNITMGFYNTNIMSRKVYISSSNYLKNMGVASSFSISLLVNDELWGLIACHNYSPKFIDFKANKELFSHFNLFLVELVRLISKIYIVLYFKI